MKAVNIRTEYLKNPLGIDISSPRIMWNCDEGIKQTAYRVTADGFDSGRIESDSMRYAVPIEFTDSKRFTFHITLWDEFGNEGEPSEEAFFEYGIRNFNAKWITGNYLADKKRRYPADCFKKEFTADGEVLSARLYISACGIYTAEINGTRVSFPLAPGITDYNRRVQYQTYDITGFIKQKNEITLCLADGWYRGSCGAWGLRNQYGTETKIIAQIDIKYKNKASQRISTDETWSWSNDSDVRFADNKDGEIIEAYRTPSYRFRARVTEHSVIPSASDNVSIAEKEKYKGEILISKSGKKIIDFKQNLAGFISFKLNARKGQKIKITLGELLDKDQELTLKNIQCSNKKITTPLQRVEYTCKDGANEYKTRFAIFGFRYALIETDVEFTADDFTAIAVYSDMEETGFFESSNGLLNKFFEATKQSAKSNSTDLPTDCPTRERHGWTGDAQIFLNTASYLFSYAPFAIKFERDLCDEQKKNGCFRQIAPKGGVDFYMNAMDGSAGWSDAGVLIPYRIYKKYNDITVLERFYENMRRYADYKIKTLGKPYPTAVPTGINLKYVRYISNYGQSYGEWAEPADVRKITTSDFVSPHPEETTAYIVYMLECMTEIALALNKHDDARRFKRYANKARIGYSKLAETKKYSLETDRQSKLVRPLAFNLLSDSQKKYAKKRLIQLLDSYSWRVATGFLSTPLILGVLADIDVSYAYRLLENEEMPGWLFMSKSGATTVWEAWEGTNAQGGIGSLNHYSKGAVCEWLFSSMCGINVDGENRFIIKPLPGGHFTFANAEYTSIFGAVKSGWRKENGEYKFDIVIPPNCTADIILPDGKKYSVGAGTYTF